MRLRPGRSEHELLKRRSTLDPAGLFRRSEKADSDSSELAPARGAVSADGGRPDPSHVRPSVSRDSHDIAASPKAPASRRFSMLRFRHASDSQLSTTAKEHADRDAPPVPSVPASAGECNEPQRPPSSPPPPTFMDPLPVADPDPEPPRRRRLQAFTLRRRSFDPATVDRPGGLLRKSMDRKRKQSKLDLRGDADVARASTSHDQSEARDFADSAALAPPSHRASESSRSDGSSGGHVSFETNTRPAPQRIASTRFAFGRRKQRASLFPLPMKIEPPQFPDTAPATPRPSTGCASSPTASPPLTARRYTADDGAHTSPLLSSSQVALAANSLGLASPTRGSLYRNDSSRSAHSARSSPQPLKRIGLRGRSSTMGSLGGMSDDNPTQTPPNGLSGRTSTSTTAGRSSFSNLFSLGRFRQNDLHPSRHGSPAHNYAGTSASSHQNSLSISRETLVMPERVEGETPGRYLERIEANNVDKSVIASFLSKTEDAFLLSVLRSYMRRFAFFGDPIDMAIRKLLMQIELPKETQQIDRVLQGFADRYHECNPGIYLNTAADKAYFISFSIIILHTDFFNKNNKRKMQRPDYIKNSSCEGVSDDVLGCIYDNIVYTPFIHIEDEVDLKNISSKKSRRTAVLKGPNDPARKAKREPIDPYTLIFEGKLDVLRPTIKDVMNLDDPYNYLGTAATLDTKNLYKSFTRYGVIQIVSSRSRPEAFMSEAAQENPFGTSVGIVEMPVTKVGILWRKDPKRKKARSPWQEWGAVLTRSGLSLFRNSSWAKNLMTQHEQHVKHGETGPAVFSPALSEFKQDHMIPMDGAVALVDNTYKRHKNAFSMCSKIGEETFLADSEQDLNDWLGVLNYTAAFETMGVRSRGMIGGLYEGQKNRGIRRLDSSQSGKSMPSATGEVVVQSGKIDHQFAQEVVTARRETMQARISDAEDKLADAIKELEARLRDARHLQILAPIQPKTRELVIHAAGRLSARLKWSRVEIWRMKCHRDILAHELDDEKQSATETQARNDKIAESSQPPPPVSNGKASKIAGLARLASKTSSLTSSHRPPHSPEGSTARPTTKSSANTEMDEAVFKTPPETSRQTSPTFPSGSYSVPPISFSPPASDRRSSMASSSMQSPKMYPADKRPSVSTFDDGTIGSDDESDDDVRYATPPLIESDAVHPKTAEPTDGAAESDAELSLAAHAGSPASRTKHRRSLHRTLRDSHGGTSHRRSHKGRDSASTITSEGASESEGLNRSKGSFTVHGKKASVIQFGPDWHNSTAEERLKAKKQLQEAQELASADERDGSVSDGTVVSPVERPDDAPRRKLSSGQVKQRHVSAQTITPDNFHQSLEYQDASDGDSELSDVAEERTSKDGEERTSKDGEPLDASPLDTSHLDTTPEIAAIPTADPAPPPDPTKLAAEHTESLAPSPDPEQVKAT
ncbi:protein transport protein sec73 [Boeremia exigua]|uniref:protein transport protein sec73 n=1 Tax=Boeremia exigua TaxID=749465 RepID=UPI001E8DEB20|nr:protein transport protein sec73 [Boeremia exigua]KAH6625731.1 protein transport protein sec73 [Boeremia exigua]